MTLRDEFILDSGSVIGRLHVEKHMNNQDGLSNIFMDDFIAAVVSDGCSGSPHSEVGSYLTATYVLRAIFERFVGMNLAFENSDDFHKVTALMEEVRLDTASFLRSLAAQLGPSMHMMQDFGLATAAGFVMTPTGTFVFSIGDSCLFVNGFEINLNNKHAAKPDMVIYGAMNPALLAEEVRNPFTISAVMSTSCICSIVVGTDGMEHLIASAGQPYPGLSNNIPDLQTLIDFEKVQPVLRAAGKTVYRAQYDKDLDIATQTVHKSPLLDDTTMVILRRKNI